MKTQFIILNLAVCALFLFISCRKTESGKNQEIVVGGIYLPLTNNMESTTNSYVMVGNSSYCFNSIEGVYYSYKPTFNNNVFCFRLMSSEHKHSQSIKFEIFTGVIQPESFFQKGIRKVDTFYIHNDCLSNHELNYRKEYHNIQSVFTWDTVFYENRLFKGKGSFEIMETLYTDYQSIYYPPQKIEFEFN
jgi:hypothetical protein